MNQPNILSQFGVPAEMLQPDELAFTSLTEALSASEQKLDGASRIEQMQLYYRIGFCALMLGDVRLKAVQAFTQMHVLAHDLGDKRMNTWAHLCLGYTYDVIGSRNQALYCAQEAQKMAQELGDRYLEALALNEQAQFLKENGQNVKAYALFSQIEAIGVELDNPELLLGAQIGFGRTTPMSQPFTAVAHYEKAIAMAQDMGNLGALALCYNNLAGWKTNMGLYEESVALHEKCLEVSRQIESKQAVGRSLVGIAKTKTLLGQLDEAYALLNRGLPVVLSAGDIEGELHTYLNLAYLYVQKGDIPRACDYYRLTLDKSIAAPDHACAVFAQKALELLADGGIPQPGILPAKPLTLEFIAEDISLGYTYQTGDQRWGGMGGAWRMTAVTA